MCEPVSASTAIILGITGAATSLIGSGVEADAARRQGQAEKELAGLNADLLARQGVDARMRGATDAGLMRWGTTHTIAQQRALAGASGVAMDSGSTLGLHEDTRFIGELDAATIANNAAREAWGFETQATILRRRGQMAEDAGSAAAVGHLLGGVLGAGKQLLPLR
jgi:hypothetical protein